MSETYAEIEERINQAIVALKTRKNVSRNKIAEEFRVPVNDSDHDSRVILPRAVYEDYI